VEMNLQDRPDRGTQVTPATGSGAAAPCELDRVPLAAPKTN
jgi:hypothetical protein